MFKASNCVLHLRNWLRYIRVVFMRNVAFFLGWYTALTDRRRSTLLMLSACVHQAYEDVMGCLKGNQTFGFHGSS